MKGAGQSRIPQVPAAAPPLPPGPAPARRQATLSVASALLCLVDILLAPLFLMAAAFAGDAPNSGAGVYLVILLLVGACGAAIVCPIVAFVAGLAGAPRRLVLGVAAVPVLALGGFVALLVINSP
jgi:uncharacterized oligopeptide transporter (OPT) family protein